MLRSRLLRIGAALCLTVVALAPASPGGAQTTDDPFSDLPTLPRSPSSSSTAPLAVQVDLSTSRDGDQVGLSNLTDVAITSSYYDDLATSVVDALGVDRSKRHVDSTTSEEDDYSFDSSDFDVTVSIDDRLSTHNSDDTWTYKVDTAALRRVARTWNFPALQFVVCTNVPSTDNTNPQGEVVDDDCYQWNQAVTAPSVSAYPLTVDITQKPDEGNYWSMVGTMAAITVGLTIVFSLITWALRRGFLGHLGTGNLICILILVSAALVSWFTAAIVLAVIGSPVTDFVLARDLGPGANFSVVVLPALLCALPFVGPALVLTGARPPKAPEHAGVQSFGQGPTPGQPPQPGAPVPPTPSQPSAPPAQLAHEAPPGVPSWLGTTPSAPTPPTPPPVVSDPEKKDRPDDDSGQSWHAPS